MCKPIGTLAVTLAASLLSVIAFLSCLTGCRNVREGNLVSATQDKQELRLTIPQAAWEPFLFKDIDARATEAHLPSLRTTVLPNDDVEVRIWFVDSYHGMDGVVIRRATGQWSAVYLYGLSKDPHFKKYQKPIGPPSSGWEAVWQNLASAGLLKLPDATELKCNGLLQDGIGYVVETNTEKTYRTYMYDNPQVAKCDEAKHMIRIVQILNDEFGVQWPTTR